MSEGNPTLKISTHYYFLKTHYRFHSTKIASTNILHLTKIDPLHLTTQTTNRNPILIDGSSSKRTKMELHHDSIQTEIDSMLTIPQLDFLYHRLQYS